MKKELFGPMMLFLYGIALIFAAAFVHYGWHYYSLPLLERPHHALHVLLKTGGLYGHGLGVIGSSMILLLFLYSARKRHLFGLRGGRMSHWLNVHIFFGIIGPVLITLHTAMKFNGIVSISYFSMLAVMFSGILGRYIYKQIPRNSVGDALSLEQIDMQDRHMTQKLVNEFKISPEALRTIQQISGAHLAKSKSGMGALFAILANDLKRPLLLKRLQNVLRAQNLRMQPAVFQQILRTAKQKSLLMRKRAFLDSVDKIFHYWHVIHKPFAYVMIIIMFLHIALTITFGYRWIF